MRIFLEYLVSDCLHILLFGCGGECMNHRLMDMNFEWIGASGSIQPPSGCSVYIVAWNFLLLFLHSYVDLFFLMFLACLHGLQIEAEETILGFVS